MLPLTDKRRSRWSVVSDPANTGRSRAAAGHEQGLGGRDLRHDGPQCGFSQCHGHRLGSQGRLFCPAESKVPGTRPGLL